METVDKIEEVVNSITADITINEVNADGNNFELLVDCTYHLAALCEVTINGGEFKVLELDVNERILVKPKLTTQTPPAAEDVFTVPAPRYYHGTVLDVNSEMLKDSQSEIIFPLVYVVERLSEKEYIKDQSGYDKQARLRLFFISQDDRDNWKTNDHYSQVIKPMKQLKQMFFNRLRVAKGFATPEVLTVENVVKLGLYTTEEGVKNNKFDYKVSGVFVDFDQNIKNCLTSLCNL